MVLHGSMVNWMEGVWSQSVMKHIKYSGLTWTYGQLGKVGGVSLS